MDNGVRHIRFPDSIARAHLFANGLPADRQCPVNGFYLIVFFFKKFFDVTITSIDDINRPNNSANMVNPPNIIVNVGDGDDGKRNNGCFLFKRASDHGFSLVIRIRIVWRTRVLRASDANTYCVYARLMRNLLNGREVSSVERLKSSDEKGAHTLVVIRFLQKTNGQRLPLMFGFFYPLTNERNVFSGERVETFLFVHCLQYRVKCFI